MSRSDDARRSNPAAAMAGAWVDASARLMEGALRANSALVSLLDPEDGDAEGTESLAYTDDAWETDLDAAEESAVSVGDVVTFTKRLTEEDVRAFAAASGDTNRLHLDEEYAEGSRFGDNVVHGSLVGGLISAALARLPGLTVYLSQEMAFTDPVGVGDEVTARCEVLEALGGGQFRLATDVFREDGEQVVDGEAVVLIDEAPEQE